MFPDHKPRRTRRLITSLDQIDIQERKRSPAKSANPKLLVAPTSPMPPNSSNASWNPKSSLFAYLR
jgi:hypothetical protein